MSALPPDYDEDPDRWASHDRSTYLRGDVHDLVAARIVEQGLEPVLDIGCGDGRLTEALPSGWPWLGVDSSATQLSGLADTARVVMADATRLPIADASVPAVAALWMLYHLSDPLAAIAEAHRVLCPGGRFFACTSARTNDPELTDAYPATTFDAEDAPDLVASAFGNSAIEVIKWDAPLVELTDRRAVVRYLRSHCLPAAVLERVTPPLTLTKRGCLVIARRDAA